MKICPNSEGFCTLDERLGLVGDFFPELPSAVQGIARAVVRKRGKCPDAAIVDDLDPTVTRITCTNLKASKMARAAETQAVRLGLPAGLFEDGMMIQRINHGR